MRNYQLKLECSPDLTNYDVKSACNSVDLSLKKMIHAVNIDADFSDFNICLIHGNSGSGKTTFAKHVFGENIFDKKIDENKSIIEQIPDKYTHKEKIEILCSIGLSSVPEWIKPVKVLSNGERARAEIAYFLSTDDEIYIDEFTSVLDRTVAKITAHSVQKYVRKYNKKIVICSVHADVKEWLNADIEIDMNSQTFIDRRGLWRDYKRSEKIKFEVREAPRSSWKMFSKYHYLSDNLPGGKLFIYGLYLGEKQIGFQCFANYTPKNKMMYHSNRTVILPEYVGLGLGICLINETSKIMKKNGYEIRAKYSSTAVHTKMKKDKNWKFLGNSDNFQRCQMRPGKNIINKLGQRRGVVTYQYKFIG